MSEKRFSKLSSSIDYFDVWDSVEEKGYTVDELVDKLNKQQATINNQKKELDRLRKELVKVIARQIPNNYAEYRDKYGKYDRKWKGVKK